MKINKFKNKDLKEEHIDIYYRKLNNEIRGLFDYLSIMQTLIGRDGMEQVVLNPFDVFYIEVVDKKYFAYMDDKIYQIDLSLQEVIDLYSDYGFVRVSKSMVVNIYKIKKLKADVNMRVNIQMENDEMLIMNRSYKKMFYQYLKERERSKDDEKIK